MGRVAKVVAAFVCPAFSYEPFVSEIVVSELDLWATSHELHPCVHGRSVANPLQQLGYDHTLVLSLDRRSDRRAHMTQFASQWDMCIDFFSAVDSSNETQSQLLGKRGTLAKAEVACFESHHRLLKEAYSKGYQHTLVLEDDVVIGHGIESPALLHNISRRALAHLKDGYDVLYLGHCFCDGTKMEKGPRVPLAVGNGKDHRTWELRHAHACLCTHAYLVSRKGIQQVLKAMENYGHVAFDSAIELAVRMEQMRAFVVVPPLFDQVWQQIPRAQRSHNQTKVSCSDVKLGCGWK